MLPGKRVPKGDESLQPQPTSSRRGIKGISYQSHDIIGRKNALTSSIGKISVSGKDIRIFFFKIMNLIVTEKNEFPKFPGITKEL